MDDERPEHGSEATSRQSRQAAARRPGVRRALRLLYRAFQAIAVLYLGLLVMLTLMQRYLLFPRHMAEQMPHMKDAVEGLEVLWIDSPQGRVEAWFIPAREASPSSPAPMVVFAHGNGELIDWWPTEMATYRALGFSVLLPEYRGYGRSAGAPSEAAITEDFIAFYDMVTARPDVDAARVVYHGRSLGGGALCALGRHRRPAALVLESTFTSIPDIVASWWVPGFLVRDRFDSASWVADYDGPTLVIHGTLDGVVPYSHGQRLAKLASHSTLMTRRCGHNDCPRDAAYWTAIAGLVRPLSEAPR